MKLKLKETLTNLVPALRSIETAKTNNGNLVIMVARHENGQAVNRCLECDTMVADKQQQNNKQIKSVLCHAGVCCGKSDSVVIQFSNG